MPESHPHQRRTVRVLMMCVVPAGMGTSGGYAAVAVLAKDLTDSGALAGIAAAGYGIGSTLATLPLARFMARNGRRPGLVRGWAVAGVGAAIATIAAILGIYPLLLIGTLGIGVGNATSLSARYAAADLATDDTRARTIGILVWASAFGSVFGPAMGLGPASRVAVWLGFPELAGPFLLGVLVLTGSAVLVHIWLRPDPLVIANGVDTEQNVSRPPLLHVFGQIWSHPGARLAVLAMLVGQAVMVGVMTMTPLHMKDGDQSLNVIGLMISVHIIGMYFFTPIVGWLTDRIGPHPLIVAAGILLFAGAEMASRTEAQHRPGVFWGLFLIGLGWSFGLVAGSSLLTSSIPAENRVEAQGAADLIMIGSGAAAGVTAGLVVQFAGYRSLSHWSGVGALVLVAAVASRVTRSSKREDSPEPEPVDTR